MSPQRGIHSKTRSGLRPLRPGEKVVFTGGVYHIVLKGIHSSTKAGLRTLKAGEKIVYRNGAYHIVKKDLMRINGRIPNGKAEREARLRVKKFKSDLFSGLIVSGRSIAT